MHCGRYIHFLSFPFLTSCLDSTLVELKGISGLIMVALLYFWFTHSVKCCYTHSKNSMLLLPDLVFFAKSDIIVGMDHQPKKHPLLVFTDKVAILSLKSLKNILWVALAATQKTTPHSHTSNHKLDFQGGGELLRLNVVWFLHLSWRKSKYFN